MNLMTESTNRMTLLALCLGLMLLPCVVMAETGSDDPGVRGGEDGATVGMDLANRDPARTAENSLQAERSEAKNQLKSELARLREREMEEAKAGAIERSALERDHMARKIGVERRYREKMAAISSRAKDAGVNVPEPLDIEKNVLIMKFIGKDGQRAPLLKETVLDDYEKVFRLLMTYLKRLYRKGGLVHADMSEYNVIIWKGRPVIFDVAQSVLIKHPMADRFLRRDLENLHRYFKRKVSDIYSVDEMYERITGGRK